MVTEKKEEKHLKSTNASTGNKAHAAGDEQKKDSGTGQNSLIVTVRSEEAWCCVPTKKAEAVAERITGTVISWMTVDNRIAMCERWEECFKKVAEHAESK